ncbi:hypothetical protein NHQ30_006464 [Ciborinia camelliae]|nr:hypothetical protein NHQ30_006464 [Ciborinia camelliae]
MDSDIQHTPGGHPYRCPEHGCSRRKHCSLCIIGRRGGGHATVTRPIGGRYLLFSAWWHLRHSWFVVYIPNSTLRDELEGEAGDLKFGPKKSLENGDNAPGDLISTTIEVEKYGKPPKLAKFFLIEYDYRLIKNPMLVYRFPMNP